MQLSFLLDPTPAPRCEPSNGKHDREVTHRNTRLVYRLQRSRRRSIGLHVNDEGLTVTAPSWVSLQQIDEAVIEKFDWVIKKLHEQQARQQRLKFVESNWRSGGVLAYLGCRIQLQCGPSDHALPRHEVWFDGDPAAPVDDQRLCLPLPPESSSEQVRDLAQAWLQRQARICFESRLARFEAQTGLKPNRWRLSSAQGRWGACNSDGNVTLNWRLIHFELPVIDYVIAHELAHLKELNHSSAFWQTLQSIYPGYLRGYQALKGLSPGDAPAV
jgi:predicted metal-dependent hydrolase